MKTLLSLCSLMFITAIGVGQQTVNLSMGGSYANRVFYKLSTDDTQSFTASDWEIAFLRTSATNMAIRINDQIGLEVFEASDDITQWNNIDIADEANWTPLYNSEIMWNTGAFDNGSAGYGWGEYDPNDHHVKGTVIFVIKYSGKYVKLIIEDYFGGYTFTYATWDGTAWGADVTETVANTGNPDNIFNYYNFTTGSEVVAEPAATDWDIVFTKYTEEVQGQPYPVTGVLHHPDIQVAEGTGTSTSAGLSYSTDINTIGYDWKSYDMNAGGYTVDSTIYYYVKTTDGEIYKVNFLTFDGQSTGDISFQVEDVTAQMNTVQFDTAELSIYPNPAPEKRLNLLYDAQGDIELQVFSLNGKQVYQTTLPAGGFTPKQVDLSQLNNGTYLMRVQNDGQVITKKIILQ